MSADLVNEYVDSSEQDQPTRNPDMKWYVIHTYSQYENKVKQCLDKMIENANLHDTIEKVVIPMVEETVVLANGKEKTELKKAFPGYVLVKMVYTKESWYLVRNVKGVTGFVGPDPMSPTPLSPEEVHSLNIETDVEYEKEYILGFAPGDRINVIGGPLLGATGTVEAVIPEKKCIKTTISMFGRMISAELEYSQVEKAD